MKTLILIAGGAIALMAAPAHAGGTQPAYGNGLLQCLTCGGSGGGSPIVSGNLKAVTYTNVAVRGRAVSANGKVYLHAPGVDSKTYVRAKTKLPSLNLGSCGCK